MSTNKTKRQGLNNLQKEIIVQTYYKHLWNSALKITIGMRKNQENIDDSSFGPYLFYIICKRF